jgi:hypothetical protein
MTEIYIETIPEHYKGEYPAVTIKCRPSQNIEKLEEVLEKHLAGEVSE